MAGGVRAELRTQLNDFLLRSIIFVNDNWNNVPAMTSANIAPFGLQVGCFASEGRVARADG